MSEKESGNPSLDEENAAPLPAVVQPVGTGVPRHEYPEGSIKGWLAVFGAWAIMFITFGYINCFGVYEAYYLHGPLRNRTPSDISWIGSIQLFVMFSAGLVSGPLNDQLGPRIIIIPCALLFALAILLTSLCTRYYEFVLCQGVFGGMAMGFVYSPAIAVVGHYFQRKRPLVMGIAASGSALAGIVLPIVLDKLLNHTSLGFGWSQRIIGFIILAFALLAALTIHPGVEPRKGTYLLPGAFKKPAYSFQVIGLYFVFWGLFMPFFYLPTYAQQHKVSVSLSFYLITILNGGSFVGRLVAGGLGVKIGQFNVLAFASFACSVLIFSWLRIQTSASLIVFAVLYGFFSGAVIGTMITTIPHLAPHPSQIGTYIGMMSGVVGIAALTGGPITGAMILHFHGYKEATIFSGAVALFGSFLVLAARFAHGGRSITV